jgi:hypothetical protein
LDDHPTLGLLKSDQVLLAAVGTLTEKLLSGSIEKILPPIDSRSSPCPEDLR